MKAPIHKKSRFYGQGWHKTGGASPLGVARAACFEQLAGVFASSGAMVVSGVIQMPYTKIMIGFPSKSLWIISEFKTYDRYVYSIYVLRLIFIMVYSLDKQTLSENQVIKVYLYEEGGQRNLEMTIDTKDINKAASEL